MPSDAPGASGPVALPITGRRRTHPLTVAVGIGGVALGFVLGLLLEGGGLVGALVALGGALRFVGWFFRTYELRADDLVISTGVLTRRDQVVPYDRVQQIDFHRGVIAQILGLTELRIDTAGSSKGRVQLAYLDRTTADTIRSWVLARRHTLTAAEPGGVERRVEPALAPSEAQYTLSSGQLLLAGATATAPVIGVTLLVIATPIVAPLALTGWDAALRVFVGYGIAAGIVTLVIAQSAIGHVLTYARFRVTVVGDDLQVDYGLFEVQHLTVPRRRVQRVSITDNPIRRAFGFVSLTIHSAAAGGGEHATHFTIVALPREHVAEVLSFVLPLDGAPRTGVPDLEARPRAAARRAVVRRSLLIAVPSAVVVVVWFPWGVGSLIAVALGVPWGRAAHRRAGHAVTGTAAVFGAGAIVRHVHIVPVARVQSGRTRTSPFQRRARLSTLRLDVPGAAPGLYDMDCTTAVHLLSVLPLAGAR